MSNEARAATRLEWALIWTALAGLALLVIAWHLSALRGGPGREAPGDLLDLLEERLPPPQKHDFEPKAAPWDQSEEGLKAAALEQVKAAQLLGRDESTSIRHRSTCRTGDILPISMVLAGATRPPSLYDLVVTDVQVGDYKEDTARVRVIFRHATDQKLRIANELGGTERWDYVLGGWVNRSCEYSEGPSIQQLFRDGTIRLAD